MEAQGHRHQGLRVTLAWVWAPEPQSNQIFQTFWRPEGEDSLGPAYRWENRDPGTLGRGLAPLGPWPSPFLPSAADGNPRGPRPAVTPSWPQGADGAQLKAVGVGGSQRGVPSWPAGPHLMPYQPPCGETRGQGAQPEQGAIPEPRSGIRAGTAGSGSRFSSTCSITWIF